MFTIVRIPQDKRSLLAPGAESFRKSLGLADDQCCWRGRRDLGAVDLCYTAPTPLPANLLTARYEPIDSERVSYKLRGENERSEADLGVLSSTSLNDRSLTTSAGTELFLIGYEEETQRLLFKAQQ